MNRALSRIKASITYLREFIEVEGLDFKMFMLTFSGLIIALFIMTPFHVNEYAIFGSVAGVMGALMVHGITSSKTAIQGLQQPQKPQEN